MIAALATICFALTLAAFAFARAAEYRTAQATFERRAAEQAGLVRQQLLRTMDSVQSIADVVRLNPQVSEATFQQHASLALDRHWSLYSLAWSEWVSHDQREAVVEAIRGDGYNITDIDEVDGEGRRHPAETREWYLVVRHLFPPDLAADLVGTNVLVRPDREPVARHATDTAQPAATRPIHLWANISDQPGVIVFVPIFDSPQPPDDIQQRREQLRGTVSVGVHLQPALERWLRQDWARHVHTVIYDPAAMEQGVLFEHGDGSLAGTDLDTLRSRSLATEQAVEFAGREWHVLSVPTRAFDAEWRSAPVPWLVLGSGLLVTVLLPLLMRAHLRHHAVIAELAEERAWTAERLQQMNDALEQRVTERTDQLQRTTIALSQAEQRERQKLARVLHDDHQQMLVATKMQVGLLGQAEASTLPQKAQRVCNMLDTAIQSSRSLSYELHTPALYSEGLAAALRALVPQKQEKYGLTLHVDADDRAEPASEDVRVVLFELVRELLVNVVKHAGTDEAWVSLRRNEQDQPEIIVEDRGCGFDRSELEEANGSASGGLGLAGMQERLAVIGGELEVDSEPGRGTRVAVRISTDVGPDDADATPDRRTGSTVN